MSPLDFLAYAACPRGAGDRDAHRAKCLVHRIFLGRLCCIDELVAARVEAGLAQPMTGR